MQDRMQYSFVQHDRQIVSGALCSNVDMLCSRRYENLSVSVRPNKEMRIEKVMTV